VGQALNALCSVPYAAQLAHGWTRLGLSVNAVAVALLAPVTLWLVPRHGAMAAGWIWAAVNVGYVVVQVMLMHRRILRGEAARWYLQAFLAPLVASTVMAASFAALRHRQEALSDPALLALIVACSACAMLAALTVTPSPRNAAIALLRPCARTS
jgi:O-antigen/teichoic acid export membrane protein